MDHKKWIRDVEGAELALRRLLDSVVEIHKDQAQNLYRCRWVRSWSEYNILCMLENLKRYRSIDLRDRRPWGVQMGSDHHE